MSFPLGKLAPHPEHTHPRVKLQAHLTGPYPIPEKIDWYSKVDAYPMLLNDSLGDCTAAGYWHLVQGWTAFAGTEFEPTDQDALDLYEPTSGYNPQTGANDNGAVEQDVLAYLSQYGVDGHKVAAFAQVDHTSQTSMLGAINAFGGVYVGIQCPQSMQQQFSTAQPGQMPVIDYVPGSPVEGGHCIVIVGWNGTNYIAVTWGALVEVTPAFWEYFGDEAWAIVTQDFIEANGEAPTGVNLQGLLAEFQALGLTAYQPDYQPPVPAHHAKPSLIAEAVETVWNWLRSVL